MWTRIEDLCDDAHMRRGIWVLTDQVFKTHELVSFEEQSYSYEKLM